MERCVDPVEGIWTGALGGFGGVYCPRGVNIGNRFANNKRGDDRVIVWGAVSMTRRQAT